MRKTKPAGFATVALSVVSFFSVAYAVSRSRADVRGTVSHVARVEGREGVLGRVLIEGVKERDTEVDRASVTVTAETRLSIERDGVREPAAFTDLKKGQKVEARFTGPVLESYPVQATAGEIIILGHR